MFISIFIFLNFLSKVPAGFILGATVISYTGHLRHVCGSKLDGVGPVDNRPSYN